MAVNKVEINGEVKLDLTQDTVTENTLLKGVTAHDAAGNSIEGKVVTTPVPKTYNLLKGDGAGGVSAATPGTDYLKTAPVTSVNGKTGAVNVSKSDVGLGNVDNVSINTRLNRTTNVNAADTNYTSYMARGEALFSAETTPSVNGAIAWQYG